MNTTQGQPNVRQAVPFLWVRDLEDSLRFYVDGLGCQISSRWVHDGRFRWCWLQLGEAALMLQEFWKEGKHRNIPDTPVGLGVSINFTCVDAVAFYRELRSRGVEARRPSVGNGWWVTQTTDPDGYRLFFQSPTDAPEESVLPDDA